MGLLESLETNMGGVCENWDLGWISGIFPSTMFFRHFWRFYMEPEEWTLKTTGLLKGLALNPEPYSLCRLHGLCWCTSQRVASTFKIGHVIPFICLSNVKSALNEVGSRMHPCGLHLKQEASKQMPHTQPERPGFYMGG